MWGNNKKSDTEAGAAGNDPSADGLPMTVGRYLKSEREARGEDLPEVADMLRIHRSYLQAIEESEIDKLPGPTYAVGFVRAYAEHLGLDGEQVIARFKEEGKVHDRQTQLVFPSPLPEGRVPSGAVLLLALVLLSAAYGGWVYVSSPSGGIADMVPSLPDKFASMIESDPPAPAKAVPDAKPAPVKESEASATTKEGEAPPKDATTASTEKAATEKAATEKAGTEKAATEKAATETTVAESSPAANQAAESGPTPPKTPESVMSDSTSSETSEPPQAGSAAGAPATPPDGTSPEERTSDGTAPEGTAPDGAAPVQAAAASASETVASAAPEPRDSPASTDPAPEPSAANLQADDINAAVPQTRPERETASAAAPETAGSDGPPAPPGPDVSDGPKVYGEPGSGSRITIRAAMDSWVEIRDRQGDRLLTRVLRAGDRYHVPDRAGLTLVTGNAGGLEFAVDGAAVPAIGPVGDVRRNVSLSPDALKDGTAHTR